MPFHFRNCPSSGVRLPNRRPFSPVTVTAPGPPLTSPPIAAQENAVPSFVNGYGWVSTTHAVQSATLSAMRCNQASTGASGRQRDQAL